jgi:hypothetical protein
MQMVEELSEEEKELPLFMGVKDPESRVVNNRPLLSALHRVDGVLRHSRPSKV